MSYVWYRGGGDITIANPAQVTEKGLSLKELAPEATVEDVRAKTAAEFAIAGDLSTMSLD